MWTVIYITQNREDMEKMRALIEENKIITIVRTLKKKEEENCYEILVPASEVCMAHGIILETEL